MSNTLTAYMRPGAALHYVLDLDRSAAEERVGSTFWYYAVTAIADDLRRKGRITTHQCATAKRQAEEIRMHAEFIRNARQELQMSMWHRRTDPGKAAQWLDMAAKNRFCALAVSMGASPGSPLMLKLLREYDERRDCYV